MKVAGFRVANIKPAGLSAISFFLALLAVIGFIVQPIAPAYAAAVDGFAGGPRIKQNSATALPMMAEKSLDEFILDSEISRGLREKLAEHAARGEAAILSTTQLKDLEKTHPALYAKLIRAYRTATTPNLTAAERKLVDGLTAANLATFKAGAVRSTCGMERRPVFLGGYDKVADVGTYVPQNCSDNTNGAWVVVGLLIAVIIVGPLFCAIATQLGTAPAFCRGVTGP